MQLLYTYAVWPNAGDGGVGVRACGVGFECVPCAAWVTLVPHLARQAYNWVANVEIIILMTFFVKFFTRYDTKATYVTSMLRCIAVLAQRYCLGPPTSTAVLFCLRHTALPFRGGSKLF